MLWRFRFLGFLAVGASCALGQVFVPGVVGTLPAFGSGATQSFTFQFSQSSGAQNLSVVNVLFNRVLDGQRACYLAYVVPSDTLVLVDDAGDAGGPYAGSVPLGNPERVIQNSQCAVSLTSATVSGTTFSLTLNITFLAAFGGNRIQYLAARDNTGINTDWQAMGTWQVPAQASEGTITVVGANPARGVSASGTAQAFAFTVADNNGQGDFGILNVLVNNFIDGRNACYLAYVVNSNSLLLVDDGGHAGGPFARIVLNGSAGAIQNSQCSVSGLGSTAVWNGNTLTLTVNITFNPGFAGNRIVWVAGRDSAGGKNTDWQAMGTVSVVAVANSNPQPTITSLNPTSVVAGYGAFTMAVNGTGFVSTSVVNWNGAGRSTLLASATQLLAQVSTADVATAGTVQVTVVNPAPGGGTSGGAAFSINNPLPAITTLSPGSATAGTAAFTLTVNGTGFISSSAVQWNGASRPTTFMNPAQLQAAITAADIATAGMAQVTVGNPGPGGGTSASAAFPINAVSPVPTITSLNPTSVVVGYGAFTMAVNGTGFVSTSVVNWNGAGRSTILASATQLLAQVSAADVATAGTVQVTVFNPAPGGGTSGSAAFSINNPVPSISTLSPGSATAGTAAFTLTVNGTGFISTSTVQWNGASRPTTFMSPTQLQAAIAASDIATAGTAQVTVVNPGPGGGPSGSAAFPINGVSPVPTISSLSGSSVVVGYGAFTLAVNGTGFVSGSVVNWNGVSRSTMYVSATQLLAQVAASDVATAGTVQVTVFNPAPGGGTSNAVAFSINNPLPAITTLSPGSATAGTAAFTLTVNGTGFISSSAVQWNGASRPTTFMSPTQLQAAIAASDIATAGTTAQVTVVNPGPGGGTSGSAAFSIGPNPQPTITSLYPASVVAGYGAFTLAVNGTGFVGTSVVNWNGAGRSTMFASATQLLAQVSTADVATAGSVQVTVFNPAPGGGTSGSTAFSINNPLAAITTLSPGSATAGTAAFTLTVNGTGFISSSVVQWNGASRPTTFMSPTQLQAAIAAADIATAGTAQVTVVNPGPGGGTSGNLGFTINPAASTITACQEITAAGNYSLAGNLSQIGPAACLNIHDTSNVQLDCGSDTIMAALGPAISITNVQNFSIRHCTLETSALTVLEATNSSNGLIDSNTIGNLNDQKGFEVTFTSVSNTVVSNNIINAGFQQQYSSGNTLRLNTATCPVWTNNQICFAVLSSSLGSNNTFDSNQIDGKAPDLSNGTDDGIVIADESGDILENNVIKNTWDAGIETTGNIFNAQIIANSISNVIGYSRGIGGWYWNSWKNVKVMNNTVYGATLFHFYRVYGLRPQNWDGHGAPADIAVYFENNLFSGNQLIGSSPYYTSYIPLYNYLDYYTGNPQVDGYSGERAAQPSDFQISNNTFTQNNFGHSQPAPLFSGPITAGAIIDGGGNICSTPGPNYPLVCQ